MHEIRRQWGRNIASGRHAVGYRTQKDFAAALGVTRQAVSCWERGDTAPRDEHKVRIARLLCQDVVQLFPLNRGVAA